MTTRESDVDKSGVRDKSADVASVSPSLSHSHVSAYSAQQ